MFLGSGWLVAVSLIIVTLPLGIERGNGGSQLPRDSNISFLVPGAAVIGLLSPVESAKNTLKLIFHLL